MAMYMTGMLKVLQYNLGHLSQLALGFGSPWSAALVLLRAHTQLVVESLVIDLLYVI